MFEKLEALKVEKEALKAKMRELGESAMKDAFKQFFDAHSEVDALRWRQYTPYFNDGDACYFSVDELTVRLAGEDPDESDYGDNFYSGYSKQITENVKLNDDLDALETGLHAVEEVLEETFGDHAQITVTREEITVDEYEHD